LNSSLALTATRCKNKSCLAAKRFAQILAGSFVPVASALAVVHAERGTILERTTSSPDDQNVAAVLSRCSSTPTQPTGFITNPA